MAELRLPNSFIKAFHAAVQGIRVIVGGQRVRHAVQSEMALGDAIAVAADQRAEIGLFVR